MNIMSLKRKSRAGFTLVELIVVIAILAILAGVAIPVYSGYIKKANEAADNQLLDAVNTAFGAACMENNVNYKKLSSVMLDVDENYCVTGIRSVKGLSTATIAAHSVENGYAMLGVHPAQLTTSVDSLNLSFQRYFSTNASTPFKVYKTFTYDPATGTFTGSKVMVTASHDGDSTTYTVTFSDGSSAEFTASDEDVANVSNSTFGQEMSMGELTGDVSNVVGAAITALSGTEEQKVETLRGLLGGNEGLSALGLDPSQEYTSEQLGNALVVMVASNTNEGTATTLMTALTGGGMSALIGEGGLTSPETLSNVAAAYGIMTGYANSEIGKTTTVTYTDSQGNEKTSTIYEYFTEASNELKNATGGSDGLMRVLAMMQTVSNSSGVATYMGVSVDEEGIVSYAQDSQAMADLTGYISAMNVISQNGDALINGAGVLNSGFGDSDIVALLNSIFG